MNQKFEQLQTHLDRFMALNTAITLFDWDSDTTAPPAATERTAKVKGILANEAYHALVNPEVEQLLNELKGHKDLDEIQTAIVKQLCEDFEKTAAIPAKENQEFKELVSHSICAWARAKKEDDFSVFAPYLEKLIAYQKKFADYRKKEGQTRYDVLLNDFEKGFFIEDLDRFFDKIKQAVVPLLKEQKAKEKGIDKSYNFLCYDIEKQKEFCAWISEYIGFERERGVRSEGEHPCTTNLHRDDVRITNHFYENNLESAIFSEIHESGHGIYEMGISEKLSQTPIGGGASCGMHESQSRFYENVIGRSKAFWKPIYGKLQETFSEQLGEVSLEQFIAGINLAKPGLIRTESDELTYCLHIMVRYEVEKKMINSDYPVEKLPELWNDLYEEYLGVRPQKDSEGILQDIHWATGDFGYFPSYAIGNAFAAQIYHTMKQQMDVEAILEAGELDKIKQWLGEQIHQYGMMKSAREIMKDVTGEEFNPDYYIQYLEKKYK